MLSGVLRRDVCVTLRKTLLLRCSSTTDDIAITTSEPKKGPPPSKRAPKYLRPWANAYKKTIVSDEALRNELDNAVTRRHVDDRSFDELNAPYFTHPISNKAPSVPLGYPDAKIEALITQFLSERSQWDVSEIDKILTREVTSTVTPHHEYLDKFLSDEELAVVDEKLMERAESLLKPSTTLLAEHHLSPPFISKDTGLAMLYNTDVAFVDVSENIDEDTRYMAVREVNGVLRHMGEDERDSVQNNFLPFHSQKIPTPAAIVYDDVFSERLTEDPVTLLELLDVSYTSDHPKFVQRHSQIAASVLSNAARLDEVFLTRFLPQLLQRWAQGERRGEHLIMLNTLLTVLEGYLPKSQACINTITELREHCFTDLITRVTEGEEVGGLVWLLEALEASYTADNPLFITRHTQLTTAILASEAHLHDILLTLGTSEDEELVSRSLPKLLQRWALGQGASLDTLITVLEAYPDSKAVLSGLLEFCNSQYGTEAVSALSGFCQEKMRIIEDNEERVREVEEQVRQAEEQKRREVKEEKKRVIAEREEKLRVEMEEGRMRRAAKEDKKKEAKKANWERKKAARASGNDGSNLED